jgi:hypothetical protein
MLETSSFQAGHEIAGYIGVQDQQQKVQSQDLPRSVM